MLLHNYGTVQTNLIYFTKMIRLISGDKNNNLRPTTQPSCRYLRFVTIQQISDHTTNVFQMWGKLFIPNHSTPNTNISQRWAPPTLLLLDGNGDYKLKLIHT